jgi:hypothetical protein
MQITYVKKILGSPMTFSMDQNHTIPLTLELSEQTVNQLRLPLSNGGLGLRFFTDVSNAAYLASILCCMTHFDRAIPTWRTTWIFDHFNHSFNDWFNRFPKNPDFIIQPKATLSEWLAYCQQENFMTMHDLHHHLNTPLQSARILSFFNRLRASASAFDIVRLSSMSQGISGAMFQAWPKPAWRLANNQFTMGLRLRLGLDVYSLPRPQPSCICKTTEGHTPCQVDARGIHLLHCKMTNNKKIRHNDIVHTFCDLARRAGINNSTKKEHLLIPGESSELEVDFTLFQPNFNPSDAGRSFIYDPTVITPTAPSYIDLCRTNLEAGFKKARYRKNTKYVAPCSRANRVFIPLMFYTYWDVSVEVINLIQQLADRISARRNQPLSTALLNIKYQYLSALPYNEQMLLLSSTNSTKLFAVPSLLSQIPHLQRLLLNPLTPKFLILLQFNHLYNNI